MGSNENRIKLKNQRYAEGKCVYCGKHPYIDNKKGCYDCLKNKYSVHSTSIRGRLKRRGKYNFVENKSGKKSKKISKEDVQALLFKKG